MDTVRFGRALGFGARAAAKTVVAAVDAANAPPPARQNAHREQHASASSPQTPLRQSDFPNRPTQAAERVRETVHHAQKTRAGLIRGSKSFSEAAWGPFARVSRVLWLEVTGVFFGLFALLAGSAAWTERAALHLTSVNAVEHRHLLFSLAMTVLFTYFCISSFLRAHLRSRQPSR